MTTLAILILIGILIAGKYETITPLLIVLLIEFIFFAVIFINLLNYIFQHQEVTLNSLYTAITSYLILGILFAIFYTFAAMISPEIFHYTSSTKPILEIYPHPEFFSEALYFSFVTLGTLGYGDLVPVFGPIKMIASLEAIIGQLYIAILIARLVSSRRNYKQNQPD
jgi:voltage-gated potassium channel Kch